MVYALSEHFATKIKDDAAKKNVEHQDKHERLIWDLTAARVKHYTQPWVERVLPKQANEHYAPLKSLIRFFGEKMLKATPAIKPIDYPKAYAKFNKMLDLFVSDKSDSFSIVFYAAQLSQHYTVACHPSYSSELKLVKFEEFLEENKATFGVCTYNRFIIEHKLVIMYNEFSLLVKSAAGHIAPIPQAAEKARLLQERWRELRPIVTGFERTYPNCVFSRYLNFLINYTMAKALEMDVHLSMKDVAPAEMDEVSLEDQWKHAQHAFIARAKESLNYTQALSSSDEPPSHIPGMEFCFGQNVLTKLPTADFDLIRTHLEDLSISLSPARRF